VLFRRLAETGFSLSLILLSSRFVFIMRTDPKPFGMIALHFRQRAMTSANSVPDSSGQFS